MKNNRVSFVFVVLLIGMVSSFAFGQAGATSSLSGVVVDPSGAVIPGAEVIAKQNGTGAEFKTITVENGTPTEPPVQIVSLTGPIPPYNPGGPTVGITIKNIGNVNILTMGADLKTNMPHSFNLFTKWSSLLPGQTVSATVNLIGPTAGSFSSDIPNPVTIYGTLEDGTVFNYTFYMKISLPPT